jgi:hypothetical protein
LIRTASRYPFLTGLAVVLGGFLIFSAVFVISRLITETDHVAVTEFEADGENDDGKIAVTINRVTYHPATTVRGIFSRRADATARPEYVQVDGTIALSADSSIAAVLVGPALLLVGSEEPLEREVRTRGNSCWSSGWPPLVVEISKRPGDFTVRIPVRDDPVATRILDSIRNGEMPPITLTGIYSTAGECESFDALTATTPQEITVGPLSTGPGVKKDFYPYGEPRFQEPGDSDRLFWNEWARGWVPGEF